MNKIYNNLNIENLMKTDWFKQFNKEQKKRNINRIRKQSRHLLVR